MFFFRCTQSLSFPRAHFITVRSLYLLQTFVSFRVPVLVLPSIPQDPSNDLNEWFDDACVVFESLSKIMLSAHSERIRRLHAMPKKAGNVIWWPFTQHKLVQEEGVMVIDSRCGSNFAVFKVYTLEQLDLIV